MLEKVIIQPPFRYEVLFQNEGCFLYISGPQSHFHTSTEKKVLQPSEAVLLKCGPYFVDWLKTSVEQERVEVIAIHLYPDVLKKLYQHELPKVIKLGNPDNRIQKIIPENTLSKFIESLVFYFENPVLVNDDLLELKIKELILLLLQSNMAESVHQLLSDLVTPRSATLREVVHTHLYSNLSLAEFASLCHLSLSSFKREFRKVFNDSPARYMLGKKLEKAAKLLQLSNLSIHDIAYELGFRDPSYFSRAFKAQFGCTPSDYRSQHQ